LRDPTIAPPPAPDADVDAAGPLDLAVDRVEADAPKTLDQHRADTERLRVLVDFLARPVHAPGGMEPDPDIVTAYNLAVEAALRGIRRAAIG